MILKIIIVSVLFISIPGVVQGLPDGSCSAENVACQGIGKITKILINDLNLFILLK